MKTLFRNRPTTLPRPALRALLTVALALSVMAASPSAARAQGYICAEGGGSLANDDWAKPAFEWMLRHGNALATKEGAPLRAVILAGIEDSDTPPTEEELEGAEADDAVERLRAGEVASVKQFYINAGNARDEKIAAAIREAHIVWVRGGAQSRYCRAWKGTPVEAAIRGVFARGGVVGGTSAGCAVLGEFIYDAAGGSCEATDALRDPFAKEISFTTGFLELVPGVIFDSHFTERARIARLAVFLGRIRADHGRDALGIGMDSRTALCIGPDGGAEVFGSGAACLMHLTPDSRISLLPGDGNWPTPPAITYIAVRQIVAGERVNIRQLTADLAASKADKPAGAADSDAKTGQPRKEIDRTDTLFIRGDATVHAHRGVRFIDPEQSRSALFDGELMVADGSNDVPGAVVATRSLLLKERTQNAAGGVLWVLANTDARWGSFIDMGAALRMIDSGKLQSYFPHGKLGAAMSAPVFVKTDRFKAGPKPPTARQACAFDGLRMHVLASGWSFDPATGEAFPPAPRQP